MIGQAKLLGAITRGHYKAIEDLSVISTSIVDNRITALRSESFVVFTESSLVDKCAEISISSIIYLLLRVEVSQI